MAKNKGTFSNIHGTLGGLSFYPMNGIHVVRKPWGPSAEIIKSNPNYKATRNNNMEFGGASRLGKAIRLGLAPFIKTYADSYISGRLSGKCRELIKAGSGTFGRREASITQNGELLKGFQLDPKRPLGKAYRGEWHLSGSTNRESVSLTIPARPAGSEKSFEGATHQRFVLVLVAVADHAYNDKLKRYHPVGEPPARSSSSVYSEYIAVGEETGEVALHVSAPGEDAPGGHVGLLVFLGVEHAQLLNGEWQPLSAGKGMACIGCV